MINELGNKEESENMYYQGYYKGKISVAINFKCVLGAHILKHALKGASLLISQIKRRLIFTRYLLIYYNKARNLFHVLGYLMVETLIHLKYIERNAMYITIMQSP